MHRVRGVGEQAIRILLGFVFGEPRRDHCALAVLILSHLEELLHAMFLGSLEGLQIGDERILIFNFVGYLAHELILALSVLLVVRAIVDHVVCAHLAVLFDHFSRELLIELVESNTESLDLAGCVPHRHWRRSLSHLLDLGHF